MHLSILSPPPPPPPKKKGLFINLVAQSNAFTFNLSHTMVNMPDVARYSITYSTLAINSGIERHFILIIMAKLTWSYKMFL